MVNIFNLIAKNKIVSASVFSLATIVSISFWVGLSINKKQEYLFREYNLEYEKNKTDRKISSFVDFPTVNVSYSSLIRGTKSYNNGNYVIYFGSEKCPYCNSLIYGNKDNPAPENNKELKYKEGQWHTAYKYAKLSDDSKLNSIKFIMFSDELPKETKNADSKQNVLPWSRYSNKDNNLAEGNIPGTYVRNDQSAINFRKIRDSLKTYFGSQKIRYIPTVIAYKNGAPKVFGEDKFQWLEEKEVRWKEWVKEEFKTNEESKKEDEIDWSKENFPKLYFFIKYYYLIYNK